MNQQFEIYTSSDGSTQIEVKFEGETFWLSLNQISSLFEKDKSVISRHISNIYREGELDRSSTVAKNTTVQFEANRQVKRDIEYYNLDAIISVGYRVNSKRGTQFRQWATKRLKDYLIEGVALNEKRLEQKNKEIQVLHDGIRILSRAIEEQANGNTTYAWLQQFSLGLRLLDDYDHETLDTKGFHSKAAIYPELDDYLVLVEQMRTEFNTTIFGKLKDIVLIVPFIKSNKVLASWNYIRRLKKKLPCYFIWWLKIMLLWMGISALVQPVFCYFSKEMAFYTTPLAKQLSATKRLHL